MGIYFLVITVYLYDSVYSVIAMRIPSLSEAVGLQEVTAAASFYIWQEKHVLTAEAINRLVLLLRVGERREGGRMTSPFHISISSLPSFLHPLIL
jgi:hypothetical protein